MFIQYICIEFDVVNWLHSFRLYPKYNKLRIVIKFNTNLYSQCIYHKFSFEQKYREWNILTGTEQAFKDLDWMNVLRVRFFINIVLRVLSNAIKSSIGRKIIRMLSIRSKQCSGVHFPCMQWGLQCHFKHFSHKPCFSSARYGTFCTLPLWTMSHTVCLQASL